MPITVVNHGGYGKGIDTGRETKIMDSKITFQ